MSKKRRMFEIDVPDVSEMPVGKAPLKGAKARRGPMASAISENAEALKDRQAAEARIMAENTQLAQDFVRAKADGLVIQHLPLEAVASEKLLRDRKPGQDEELEELKASIRDVGLSNPIRVEAGEDGRYELIQGMRRLMAYRALRAEHGEGFSAIPAVIAAVPGEAEQSYRQMVDENLVRKDISFAEMATLARRFAADPVNRCAGAAEAVAILFKSASYTKRSYIRAFAELLEKLDRVLEYPQDLPRNVGVELKRRLDAEPDLLRHVVSALQAEPGRDAIREVAILRGFLQQTDDPDRVGDGVAARRKGRPRQAKTTFQVPTVRGIAKCSASNGRLELRFDRDFSSVDRGSLERAVAAFLDTLPDG